MACAMPVRPGELSGLGTRSRRAVYHASINLAPEEASKLTGRRWIDAVDELEKELGLCGHQRAVIKHIKRDREKVLREHYHIVWGRANPTTLKVVSDSKNYEKHERVARRLEARWKLNKVSGVHTRPPNTLRPVAKATHKDWQAQTRTGVQVDDVALVLNKCWASTSSGSQFVAAIKSQGFTLAVGRRGIVVLDTAGTPHSLSRRLKLRAAEVQQRLAGIEVTKLPTVEAAQARLRRNKIMEVNMFEIGIC